MFQETNFIKIWIFRINKQRDVQDFEITARLRRNAIGTDCLVWLKLSEWMLSSESYHSNVINIL